MYKQYLFLVALVFLSTLVGSQPVKVAEDKAAADPEKDAAAGDAKDGAADAAADGADAAADGAAKDDAAADPAAADPAAADAAPAEDAGKAGGEAAIAEVGSLDKAIMMMNELNDQFEKIVNGMNGLSQPAGDGEEIAEGGDAEAAPDAEAGAPAPEGGDAEKDAAPDLPTPETPEKTGDDAAADDAKDGGAAAGEEKDGAKETDADAAKKE